MVVATDRHYHWYSACLPLFCLCGVEELSNYKWTTDIEKNEKVVNGEGEVEVQIGSGAEIIRDYSDDDNEGQDGYKQGGYHAVKIGDIFDQRYEVIKKLGWGNFSTVWMVQDLCIKKVKPLSETHTALLFYALKIQKSAKDYTIAAMDEVKILNCITRESKRWNDQYQNGPNAEDRDGIFPAQVVDNSHHVVTLHDSFFHMGPHGRHKCMVFPMLGCNLLSVIKAHDYRGIPLKFAKKMIKGTAKGLEFLHRRCNIIHTDLKPENILLQYLPRIESKNQNHISQILDNDETLKSEKTKIVHTGRGLEKVTSRCSPHIDLEKRDIEGDNTSKTSGDSKELQYKEMSIEIIHTDHEPESILFEFSSQINLKKGGHGEDNNSKSLYDNKELQPKQMHMVESEEVLQMPNTLTEDQKEKTQREKEHQQQQDKDAQHINMNNMKITTHISEDMAQQLQRLPSLERYCTNVGGDDGFQTQESNRELLSKGISAEDTAQQVRGLLLLERYCIDIGGDTTSKTLDDGEPLSKGMSIDDTAHQSRGLLLLERHSIDIDNILQTSDDNEKLYSKQMSIEKIKPVLQNASTPTGDQKKIQKMLEERKQEKKEQQLQHDHFAPNTNTMNTKTTTCIPRNTQQSCEFSLDSCVEDVVITNENKGSGTGSGDITRENNHIMIERELKILIPGKMQAGSLGKNNELDWQAAHPSEIQQPNLKDTEVLENTRAVVVDLGNACWTHRHFTENIQTCQYRAPEVLIGTKYDISTDMWSLGCICFELLTGDVLFDPKEGGWYSRDEDHLAMIQELLGNMPKSIALSGKYSKKLFNHKGKLKHINQLEAWPLEKVLHEKYHFSVADAEDISKFMRPLLEYDTKARATAYECLQHEWLKGI